MLSRRQARDLLAWTLERDALSEPFKLALFDAHPANFVRDTQGFILPIDLILVRAEPPRQAALTAMLL